MVDLTSYFVKTFCSDVEGEILLGGQ